MAFAGYAVYSCLISVVL